MKKNQYNKINVYLRQCSENKPSNTRPNWFDYEKCFLNLLKTINWKLTNLTIIFDGELLSFNNHFTKEYIQQYPFKVKLINTKEFKEKTYQEDGSCKSGAITARIIKEDNLENDCLIYMLENDYLHIPYWGEIVLDLYNYYTNQNHYVCLYDNLDKYIFTLTNRNDEWSMYSNLKSKIIISSYRHWRTVPLINSAWIMTKQLFDRDFDILSFGTSDNTASEQIGLRNGTYHLTPIPSLATHCEQIFLAPMVDWNAVISTTII